VQRPALLLTLFTLHLRSIDLPPKMRSHFPTLTYAIALIYTPCIRALNLDVTDASE